MNQKIIFKQLVIVLLATLILGVGSWIFFQGENGNPYWVFFSALALVLQAGLILILVIRYKQKVNEIFYLRRQLGEIRNEEELTVQGEGGQNQFSMMVIHLLLNIARTIKMDVKDYDPMSNQFPIILKNDRKEKILFKMNEIEWVRAAGNYQEVQTKEGLFKVRHSMKHIENLLESKSDKFIKVHRSWIINVDMVRAISPNWDYVKIREKLISISHVFKQDLSERLFHV